MSKKKKKIFLKVWDVRRDRIPLFWSTVRERALAKSLSLNMRDTKDPGVSR